MLRLVVLDEAAVAGVANCFLDRSSVVIIRETSVQFVVHTKQSVLRNQIMVSTLHLLIKPYHTESRS